MKTWNKHGAKKEEVIESKTVGIHKNNKTELRFMNQKERGKLETSKNMDNKGCQNNERAQDSQEKSKYRYIANKEIL